jgi:hypothetical protein
MRSIRTSYFFSKTSVVPPILASSAWTPGSLLRRSRKAGGNVFSQPQSRPMRFVMVAGDSRGEGAMLRRVGTYQDRLGAVNAGEGGRGVAKPPGVRS